MSVKPSTFEFVLHSMYWPLSCYYLYLDNSHDVTVNNILRGGITHKVFVIWEVFINSSCSHMGIRVLSINYHVCTGVNDQFSLEKDDYISLGTNDKCAIKGRWLFVLSKWVLVNLVGLSINDYCSIWGISLFLL